LRDDAVIARRRAAEVDVGHLDRGPVGREAAPDRPARPGQETSSRRDRARRS
jgi:hypothetical protein